MSEASLSTFRLAPVGAPHGARAAAEEARARATGFAAGHAAGLREGAAVVAAEQASHAREHAALIARHTAEHTARLTALDAAIRAANARTAPVLADAEQALFAAAVELAEAILERELADGPHSAQDALRRALSTDNNSTSTVRMNPTDVDALQASGVTFPETVDVLADPTISVGDAIAEHEAGFLDARITTALTRAKRTLAGDA